jgi:hypothetical protein
LDGGEASAPEVAEPALAARAEPRGADGEGGLEPAATPEPSKPNSPLAWPLDEVERFDDTVVDADARWAPVAAGRVMVRVIGAGLRAAPDAVGRAGPRCSVAVVAMWWRSRGSGPLNSPIWSQTT